MRRGLILGSAVALLVLAVPLTVVAVTRAPAQDGAHANCTASRSTATPVTTTSTSFAKISALKLNVESVFGMTESVTIVVSGSPVELKVTDMSVGGTFAMAPGVTTIDPSAGDTDAFTLAFVTAGAPAPHGHAIDVQWRLESGSGSATLKRGAVSLLYEAGDSGCPFV
jgi:hypothetical protein